MITKTQQRWTKGQSVKVGFLNLVVCAAVATPGDGQPDAYILTNVAQTQLYKFVPHNGVTKISAIEAQALLATHEEAAARAAYRAMVKAKADAASAAQIRSLFAVAA